MLGSRGAWWGRTRTWVSDIVVGESVLVAILASVFLMRVLLAGWNSYWLDELYSVAIYGVWNENLPDAIRNLAETSVHPPLYQAILYLWMGILGSGEVVTRTLSNVYVTAAAFVLFLSIRRCISRRVAVASAVVFSVMSTPLLFGLEARSYAQTILLATVSSYFLIRLITDSGRLHPRRLLLSGPAIGLAGSNFALLFTHYYNGFFVLAQSLFLAVYLLATQRPREWASSLPAAMVTYAVPGGVFWLTWGGVLVSTFRRTSGGWEVDEIGDLQSPITLLFDSILAGNVSSSRLLSLLWLVTVASLVVVAVVALVRRGANGRDSGRQWVTLYLASWVLLPLVVATVVFQIVGVARFNPRYFVFSVAAVAPLTVMSASLLARAVAGAARRWIRAPISEAVTITLALMLLVALVLPGTIDAGKQRKTDWRGAAASIVAIVHANPEARFVILEPSFRRDGVLNFYLERYGDDVRVANTIRRHEEARGGSFVFERQPELLLDHDYLIVPFLHHRVSDFPTAMAQLDELATTHLSQVDSRGRGIIVYALDPPG